MKCPICPREVDRLLSGIKNGKVVSERCERCLNSIPSHAELAGNNERTWQRREYAKDIIQPSEEGFAKAYGAEAARDRGWSDEEIRKFT